ncbi:MAG: flagellum-specific ATP synthase FliI, partial [Thermodesulfobacteriota bacterium]
MRVKSIDKYFKKLDYHIPFEVYGYVTKVLGLTIESTGPYLKIGDLCKVKGQTVETLAEVIGFKGNQLILTALGDIKGLEVGAKVFPLGSSY